jgi:hypothetical protein
MVWIMGLSAQALSTTPLRRVPRMAMSLSIDVVLRKLISEWRFFLCLLDFVWSD